MDSILVCGRAMEDGPISMGRELIVNNVQNSRLLYEEELRRISCCFLFCGMCLPFQLDSRRTGRETTQWQAVGCASIWPKLGVTQRLEQ